MAAGLNLSRVDTITYSVRCSVRKKGSWRKRHQCYNCKQLANSTKSTSSSSSFTTHRVEAICVSWSSNRQLIVVVKCSCCWQLSIDFNQLNSWAADLLFSSTVDRSCCIVRSCMVHYYILSSSYFCCYGDGAAGGGRWCSRRRRQLDVPQLPDHQRQQNGKYLFLKLLDDDDSTLYDRFLRLND